MDSYTNIPLHEPFEQYPIWLKLAIFSLACISAAYIIVRWGGE